MECQIIFRAAMPHTVYMQYIAELPAYIVVGVAVALPCRRTIDITSESFSAAFPPGFSPSSLRFRHLQLMMTPLSSMTGYGANATITDDFDDTP